jgi:PKD repeat protein
VTIPAGTTSGTFTVATTLESATTSVTISAAYHDTTKTALLTVTGVPGVLSLSVSPSSVDGGNAATGTVTLSNAAPTGGAVVTLGSSNPTVASVPTSVTVAAGLTSATFSIATTAVSAPTLVSLSATYPAGLTVNGSITVGPPGNAAFDTTLKVPRCTTVASFCDTGSTLIRGRANIANGPELDTPNTLAAACVDGTAGTFHSDESLDRLSVATLDGSPLAAGEMVKVTATVWAFDTSDFLDVFVAPDATNPVWTLMATITSTASQQQLALSTQFVLPAATLPAIRANWRFLGAAGTCTNGSFDDRDDLVFALAGAPPVNLPPAVNAGPDQSVTFPAAATLSGTATDDGLPNPPGQLTTTWSVVSGPGTVTFGNANLLSTTATFSATGTYDLRLTASDGALSASDDLIVTVAPANQPPTVSAGPDQTITLPSAANLSGTASDDGLPNPPAKLTTTWSVVSGPGSVTFGSTAALITTATFSVPGTYDLRLTASDSALTASDDVVITVNPANQPPTVNAGADQSITLPSAANLSGTASDDGLPNPPGKLTTTWSMVNGPGVVTFANSGALATTATFSVAGTYGLRLTASDGALSASDDLLVTVAPQNQPPTVNAGPDQSETVLSLPTTAVTQGSFTDDGLPNPPGMVTETWTQISGPGTATFQDVHNAISLVTFSAAGSYDLRLTISDGQLSTSDDVVITVTLLSTVNQPPVVNAGPDQTITLPAAASLNGTVTDDGLPSPPAAFTSTWSVVSGPGTVTFANASNPVTTATFSVAGTYDLRLTANDSALSASDDIIVTVNAAPPVNKAPTVSAGPNQTITLPGTASLAGTVSDDGLPNPPAKVTTTWSKVSGPGTVTFGNASATSTTATFSTSGSYVLQLAASDSALSASSTLTVTVNPAPVNKAPTVNAGPDQTITLPATASLAGTVSDDGLPNPPAKVTTTWSKVSGPGTVTFGNASATSTTATFSTSGSYVLQLAASDSALSASDTITVTVNAAPANKAPTVNAGPDLTITLPATASLNGTASDDGLPNPPGTLTVTWSKVSGPGTVTFANPNAKVTTATFSTAGTYVVQLTASDSALSASDQAQVTVNAASGGSGPCANLCSNPLNFTINGSFQSGNIGTGAVCYQTTSVMHGGNCGNFVSPRTLQVNGTTESCVGGNWASVPAARNGGYCIQTTSGNQPWAFFTAF